MLSCGAASVSYLTDAEAACASERKVGVTRPLICLAAALVNGSHGMSFLHKLSLVVVLLIDILTALASCGELAQALSIGATVVGYVAAHLVELNARRAFAKERRSEEEKRLLAEEKHRAEEEAETRLEQLAVAKERLQYDFNFVMARAHPLAGPSQPRRQSSSSGGSSLGGSGAPSSSPPPSIPPMAPSSIADSRASGLTPNDLMTGENEPMSEDEAETSQLGRGEVMDPSDVEAEFSAQEQAGSPAAAGDAVADVAQAVAASGADADAVAANIIAQHAQSSVQPPAPPAPLSHAQPLAPPVPLSHAQWPYAHLASVEVWSAATQAQAMLDLMRARAMQRLGVAPSTQPAIAGGWQMPTAAAPVANHHLASQPVAQPAYLVADPGPLALHPNHYQAGAAAPPPPNLHPFGLPGPSALHLNDYPSPPSPPAGPPGYRAHAGPPAPTRSPPRSPRRSGGASYVG